MEKSNKPVILPSDCSVSFSIAGSVGTFRGLAALLESDGLAKTITDSETMKIQKFLASMEEIYTEAAWVTSLVMVSEWKKAGKIDRINTRVAVITLTVLKTQLKQQNFIRR